MATVKGIVKWLISAMVFVVFLCLPMGVVMLGNWMVKKLKLSSVNETLKTKENVIAVLKADGKKPKVFCN